MTVPTGASASIRLPPALEGLRRLAYNLWWSWHPRAKILFSRIDNAAWARYRNPIPVLAGPVAWGELLDSPAFMADYHAILREFDRYMENGADHWFPRRYGDEARRPDRLLLRRVRLPRIAGHLLGRPRGPRGRPHEGRLATWPSRSSASGCCIARATSASRSTPTATRSTPIPTTTCRGSRCCRRSTATASR